jgi:hypothetical protein
MVWMVRVRPLCLAAVGQVLVALLHRRIDLLRWSRSVVEQQRECLGGGGVVSGGYVLRGQWGVVVGCYADAVDGFVVGAQVVEGRWRYQNRINGPCAIRSSSASAGSGSARRDPG